MKFEYVEINKYYMMNVNEDGVKVKILCKAIDTDQKIKFQDIWAEDGLLDRWSISPSDWERLINDIKEVDINDYPEVML